MKIRYNAPVTLTFALVATTVLLINQTVLPGLTRGLFIVGSGMNPGNVIDYVRLFTHVIGHDNWTHLMGNFAFILLLGPILEEKYSSSGLCIMMAITAMVTGLLNVMFLSTGLLGASGIVFMMILLVSFTNIRQGEIPLTFILVVILFLTREIVGAWQQDTVSQFAHISGGVIGSLFGFLHSHRHAVR